MTIYEGKDGIFKNVDDAIKYMELTNFKREVRIYDADIDIADKKVLELYKVIKEYNKGKPLDEQILPSKPYGYRAVIELRDVQVFSISLGIYHRTYDALTYMKGCNYSVLDK